MATKYQWEFDNAIVSEPTNALEMQDIIQYDEKLKFIYWEKSNSFQFINDAYDYLFTKYTSGFCNEVEVKISEDCELDGNYVPIFTGIIKVRDVKFDFIECKCSTNVYDNNYFAFINNNASVNYLISAGKSKNDVTITIPPIIPVTFENPCNNVEYERGLYRIDDAIKAIIAHITDDRVDYESPYFGTGGAKYNVFCGTGYQFRVINWESIFPLLGLKSNYDNFFSQLDKKYNLGVYIDYSGVKPKLIIDKYENLRAVTLSTSVVNPSVVNLSSFVSKIKNKVIVGGPTFPQFTCPDDGDFPTDITFYGFQREEFTVSSQCNIDDSLNLESSFIVDTNTLYQIVVKGVDDWDADICLIDCDATNRSILTEILGDGNFYWNGDLNNEHVIERWKTHIPANLVAYLTPTNYRFKAVRTRTGVYQGSTFLGPVALDDDYNLGSDPDDLFASCIQQGLPVAAPFSFFTAPITGNYYFKINISLYLGTGPVTVGIDTFAAPSICAGNNTPIPKLSYTQAPYNGAAQTNLEWAFAVHLDATDYCWVTFDSFNQVGFNYNGYSIFWELLNSPLESGISYSVESGDAEILKIETDWYMKKSEYETMKTNFKKYVEVHSKEQIFRGYLYGSKYDENSGAAQLTLISSNNFLDGRNS